jgi:hypothetical protein
MGCGIRAWGCGKLRDKLCRNQWKSFAAASSRWAFSAEPVDLGRAAYKMKEL